MCMVCVCACYLCVSLYVCLCMCSVYVCLFLYVSLYVCSVKCA